MSSLTLNLLPPELLQEILEDCDPKSVSNLSLTCRLLYDFVYKSPNTTLWRTLFLSVPFDDPCKCLKPSGEPLVRNARDYDWKGELQRRLRAQTVLRYPERHQDDKELNMALSTVVSMVQNTPPATPFPSVDELSKNIAWLLITDGSVGYLRSFIDEVQAIRQHLSLETQQLLSQFHTYFGLTYGKDGSVESIIRARGFVYDFRNYSQSNYYGPFFQDGSGRVNWEHLQHIMHIISTQAIHTVGGLVPLNLVYCQSNLEQPEGKFSHFDWAGVEGVWNCSFCYIDHRDLLAYNAQGIQPDGLRNTAIFEEKDLFEIFRVLNVRFTIKEVIPNIEYPLRPTLKFQGVIDGVQRMVGSVFMIMDQAVRWHFTSGEEDNMIWSSEGVQIANVQSGYGILGTWTTVFHEDGDPVGPFWLHRYHEAPTDAD